MKQLLFIAFIAAGLLLFADEAGNEKPMSPGEKLRFNEKLCKDGKLDNCLWVADVTYRGNEGVGKDLKKARQFFQIACSKNDANACSNYGMMLENGEGGGKDPMQAEIAYKKSCDNGSGLGCNNLGVFIESRKGAKMAEKAMDAYRAGCALGYQESCPQVERLAKVIATDPKTKHLQYEMACEKGETEACAKAGSVYYFGENVARNQQKAITYFTKACDAGIGSSCFSLAVMMEQGEIIPKEDKKIASWYEKACLANEPRACSNLGFMMINGDGVPMDQEMGRAFFERSCTLDHPEGCHNLGMVYVNGAGVEKNPEKAKEYLEKACKLDSKKSCDQLKKLGKGKK